MNNEMKKRHCVGVFCFFYFVLQIFCTQAETMQIKAIFENLLENPRYLPRSMSITRPYKDLLAHPVCRGDVSFFAVPWTELSDEICFVSGEKDPEKRWSILISRVKEEILKKNIFTKIGNCCFVICHCDLPLTLIPLMRFMGVDIIFTHHASGKTYEGVTEVPFPCLPINGVSPAKDKDILYSFVGSEYTHPIRKEIFKLPKKKDTVLIKASVCPIVGDRETGHDKKYKAVYKDVLSRSRFSLCPRGKGLGTYRFWESLQAGAIPILISDGLILPDGIEWDECIIRIPEELFTYRFLMSELEKISSDREEQMRKNCLQAFEFLLGEDFSQAYKVIHRYFEGTKNSENQSATI